MLLAGPLLAATPAEMDAPPQAWQGSGAKPFVERDANNKITSIGVMIPAATVKAVPKNRVEAVLPVADAGLVQTANVQWHPAGHEPAHVYDTPHFDVHFFTITENVRRTIVPGAKAGKVPPAKGTLPLAVLLAPGFVPGMGMHVIQAKQPEFNGGKFTASPIIGYWNGDLAFFEVMFTKAWLLKNQDKVGAYPQPESVRLHGLYPTRYGVHYDKAKDAYRVELTNFVKR